jgi:hypothetical protein
MNTSDPCAECGGSTFAMFTVRAVTGTMLLCSKCWRRPTAPLSRRQAIALTMRPRPELPSAGDQLVLPGSSTSDPGSDDVG